MKNELNPLKDETEEKQNDEFLQEETHKGPQNKEDYVEKQKKAEPFVEQQMKPELHLVMAQDDAYISDRIKSQPKSLDEVIFMKEPIYAPNEHRLSLPKELKEFEDRLAFRWINKKKRAIDDAIDLRGWYFVNRITFEKLPGRLFSNSGAIERGDTILMYMPKEKAEALRRIPGEKSTALIKAQLAKGESKLPKGQSGFYKPTEGVTDDDSVGTDAITEGKHF